MSASRTSRAIVLAIVALLCQQQGVVAWGESSGDSIFGGYGQSGYGQGYGGSRTQLVGYGVGTSYPSNGGSVPNTPTTPGGSGNGGGKPPPSSGGGGGGGGSFQLGGTFTGVSGGQATVAKPAPTSSGTGDPIMTGFDGRPFEFIGVPNTYYSIISERHHRVSTKLKVGVMWDHNGTYMEGIGFQYKDHQVLVEITTDDNLAVSVDGEALVVDEVENEVEVIPYVEHGEMLVLWQLHREGLGNAVQITTELLEMVVWLTPAGTEDEGGVKQPAYLNFDTALLGPPHGNEMQGVVGETYNRMLAGDAINDPSHPLFLPDDFTFQARGKEHHYEVEGYWGDHRYGIFGGVRQGAAEEQQPPADRKRQLSEDDDSAVAFPLVASGRGNWLKKALLHRQVTLRASGGRKGFF